MSGRDLRPDIALSACRGIFQSDHRKDIGKLNKPCLIIQTSDDIAVPIQVGEYLHKHIPNSKYKVVKATGHFPQLSAPKEIINAIGSFLQESQLL